MQEVKRAKAKPVGDNAAPRAAFMLSPVLAIFLIVLVDVLGLTIIMPLLPFYAEHYGASPLVVGMLGASYAICQLISSPLLGRVSDHVGRRPVLLFSQLGTLVGFIILARADALWMIFASRMLDGATAGNISLAQASIADFTTPARRAHNYGLVGMAFGIGFVIGPMISSFLAPLGYQYPAYAAAALSATSILATWFFLPSKRPQPRGEGLPARRSPTALLRDPHLRARLAQFFFFSYAFSNWMMGIGLFAERRFAIDGRAFGARELGWVFGFQGLVGIVIQGGLIATFTRVLGEERLVRVGLMWMVVAATAMVFTHDPRFLVAPLFLLSVGASVTRPALTSLTSQEAPADEQGLLHGVIQTTMSVAQICGPLIAGFMIGHGWLSGWALVTGASALVGCLLLMWSPARTQAVA